MIREKTSRLGLEQPQQIGQGLTLPLAEPRIEGTFRVVDRPLSRFLSSATLRRDLGPHGTPVAGIVDARDEPLRLEPVDELRDVRANAGTPLGQRPQRERSSIGHQLREGPVLRDRQPHGLERGLESVLDALQRLQQLDGQGRRDLIHT